MPRRTSDWLIISITVIEPMIAFAADPGHRARLLRREPRRSSAATSTAMPYQAPRRRPDARRREIAANARQLSPEHPQ